MEDAAPPGFLCPIGQTLMRDPVSCADGHSYERPNIERWLQSHTSSPKTGAQLEHTTLVPNHALRNAIEEWLISNFKLVPAEAVEINELIGRGSFKTVHRGRLRGHPSPVAVLKMADGGLCEEEAVKLVQLGRHPGLVRYLGICIDAPQQLLLTELAPLGSLDSFLEAHEDEVSFAHKLAMLKQICSGMAALTHAGLVHRDLALRNVLVFAFDAATPSTVVVKITDFGLAVERHYQTHATVQGENVPFRWMPPEALKRRRFSEKSDVWAFAVTAWELLTGGDIPFGLISSNEVVAERVIAGERLARPDDCSSDDLWRVMTRCWADKPADRPSFDQLVQELATAQGSPDEIDGAEGEAAMQEAAEDEAAMREAAEEESARRRAADVEGAPGESVKGSSAVVWYQQGEQLKYQSESAKLQVDGVLYTRKQMYSKAVELASDADGQEAWYWYCLGYTGGGEVGGRSWSQKECYQEALQLDPEYSNVWNNLGRAGGGEVGGRSWNQKECYQEALRLDPENAHAWNNLGISSGGEVGGRSWSQKECYQEALRLNPEHSNAWHNLGISGGGEVGGRSWSQKECYQEALRLNPEHSAAWITLGISGGGEVGGRSWGKKECFKEVLRLDPENSKAWVQLALVGGGEVGGRSWSQKECFEKVGISFVRFNRNDPSTFWTGRT